MMGTWHFLRRGAGRSTLAALAAGLALAVGGLATPLVAQAQITGTKHNLGTSGPGPNQFSGTAEICVFCHTPHGADTSAAVPLWNRTLPAPSSFTTYDTLGTSSLDGKVAPVGSVSIACLSCHDGVTSMSAVINAPGSGLSGGAAWTGGTWTGANQDGTGKMIGVAAIGQDLKNDHPIGIQYAGGGYSTTAISGPGKDLDFKSATSTGTGNATIWWVDTEATPNNSRQKTDMQLYTRGNAPSNPGYTGQAAPEPFVECASCHDPHTAANPTFLRISNAGSAVCLACHTK
jgi:predicted CXXCH cytochrome family protein